MTIRAAHYTFRDLFFYPSPACSTSDQHADIVILPTLHVIEVQDANIRLSTINAWVIKEIRESPFTIALSIARVIPYPATVVILRISPIVRSAIDSLARLAIRTRLVGRPAPWKHVER
jgi:hypothetical protein